MKLDIVQTINGDQVRKAQWILENVFINSFATSGHGGDLPHESYTFAFNRITYSWFEESDSISFTWDLLSGTESSSVIGTVENFQFLTGTLVPEPASAALLGFGAAAMLLGRRGRRQLDVTAAFT